MSTRLFYIGRTAKLTGPALDTDDLPQDAFDDIPADAITQDLLANADGSISLPNFPTAQAAPAPSSIILVGGVLLIVACTRLARRLYNFGTQYHKT
jgi:hypothetical protein